MLILVWIDCGFTFNSLEMGYGILVNLVFWAPCYTIFIALIHYLRINNKILGNVFYEIVIIVGPHILSAFYFYIAYKLVDNYFVMSSDGRIMHRKWFLDFGNVYIIVYSLLFILLVIHGRMKNKKTYHS
jgi:hypothetical protein